MGSGSRKPVQFYERYTPTFCTSPVAPFVVRFNAKTKGAVFLLVAKMVSVKKGAGRGLVPESQVNRPRERELICFWLGLLKVAPALPVGVASQIIPYQTSIPPPPADISGKNHFFPL